MSSFRNHRVIIASLFLPTTAVQGESGPPTPDPLLATTTVNDSEINLPAVTLRLAATPLKPAIVNWTNTHSHQSCASGPLKSIVDDLTDKSQHPTPAVRSPDTEISNPFTKLTCFAPEAVLATSPTSTAPPISKTPNNAQRPYPLPSHPTQKIQVLFLEAIKHSKHYDLPRTSEAWHLEPNTHRNSGLKYAVDSLGDQLCKWQGVGWDIGYCYGL